MSIRGLFAKQTPNWPKLLSWTIYGIQYAKVDIRTNKPLNSVPLQPRVYHFDTKLTIDSLIMEYRNRILNS